MSWLDGLPFWEGFIIFFFGGVIIVATFVLYDWWQYLLEENRKEDGAKAEAARRMDIEWSWKKPEERAAKYAAEQGETPPQPAPEPKTPVIDKAAPGYDPFYD